MVRFAPQFVNKFENNLQRILKVGKPVKPITEKPEWKVIPNTLIYGSKVMRQSYNYADYYRRSEIIKIAQKISNELKQSKLNAMIGISVKYEDIGWRGSKLTDVGDDVKLHNPLDSDITTSGEILSFELILISKDKMNEEQQPAKIKNLRNLKNKK